MTWPMVAIKDVAKVVTGKTPSKSEDDNFGGEIPFVTPAELNGIPYVLSSPQTITGKGASKLKLVPRNSVMVCCIGSLGKLAIAGREVATNQQINSVIFDEKRVDPKYGYYALSKLKPVMEKLAPSTTVAIINKSNFEALEIPLPPLVEQQRIAAILDKADAIRRKRQQAIQLADDFLRAVFLDMFGDPVTNPKGWEVKSVADLIRAGVILQVQDGNHGNDHPKVSDFTESGVPFVTANVVRRGKILFDQCYYLDHSWLDRLRIGFAKPRDVLISHKGSLGFTAVLDDTYEDYIFSPQTTYYRVNEERLLPEYLKGYFDSGFFQRLFAKEGIQSTRAYLGITRQKDLPIMIPDMSAQMRFMDVLSKYKELSGKLFEPTVRSEFFSSLSQKAFRGEL